MRRIATGLRKGKAARVAFVALAVLVGVAVVGGTVVAKENQSSKAQAAVDRAAATDKYLFIFFYGDDSDQTAGMRGVFTKAMEKVSKKADRVEISIADPAEAVAVDKYGVRGAPMPLVLAIAPNGAITGGFPAPFEEKQIIDSFATPCTQASLKALQQNKVVLLCIQNRRTGLNDAAMTGVRDLKADPLYVNAAEVITMDPSDPDEAKLLGMLGVDPKIAEAMTVCLVPPGRAVAKLSGATTKEMIAGSFKAASGGGCCPGGSKTCGPTAAGQPQAKSTAGCAPAQQSPQTKPQDGSGAAGPASGK